MSASLCNLCVLRVCGELIRSKNSPRRHTDCTEKSGSRYFLCELEDRKKSEQALPQTGSVACTTRKRQRFLLQSCSVEPPQGVGRLYGYQKGQIRCSHC